MLKNQEDELENELGHVRMCVCVCVCVCVCGWVGGYKGLWCYSNF